MVYVCKDSSLELNRQIFRTKNSSFNKYLTVCKVNLELHLIYKRSKVKYSDREKDKALASYYNGAACADEDLTAMLKDDGYIVRLTSPNDIVTRITDRGKARSISTEGMPGQRKRNA